MGLRSAISWLDEHHGAVLFAGAAFSAMSGVVYWIARGGIAPLLASLGYLSDPRIAESIKSLPDDQREVIESLEQINGALERIQESVLDLKSESLAIMDFRHSRSQRVNVCGPGEECEVLVLARLNEKADGCGLESVRLSLRGRKGVTAEVFTSSPSSGSAMGTGSYQSFRFEFLVPESTPEGAYTVTPTLLFSGCDFAERDEVLSREGPEVPLFVR